MNKSLIKFINTSTIILVSAILASFVIYVFPDHSDMLLPIIGFLFVILGVLKLYKYSQKSQWIPVKAIIISIKEGSEDVYFQYSYVRYFYPIVKYQYEYFGETVKSDNLGDDIKNIWVPEVDNLGRKIADKEKFWHKWSEGETITVYVNPSKPEQSAIVNKVSSIRRSHYLAIIVTGLLLVIIWLYLVSIGFF